MIKAILPFICTSKNAIKGANTKNNKAIKITPATKPTYHKIKIIYINFDIIFNIFFMINPFKIIPKKANESYKNIIKQITQINNYFLKIKIRVFNLF